MLYADYGRGFRSGGFNATGVGPLAASEKIVGVGDVFQAEVADTIEAGAKIELLDRRLSLDLAAFGTRSKNPYFFVFIFANATQNLGNIPEVEYKGGEFSADFRATNKLRLNLGFGYTDSEITKFPDEPSVVGIQAPDVSKYNIDFSAQYIEPLTDDISLIARAEYQRIGDTYWDPQNSTVRDPGRSGECAAGRRIRQMDGVALGQEPVRQAIQCRILAGRLRVQGLAAPDRRRHHVSFLGAEAAPGSRTGRRQLSRWKRPAPPDACAWAALRLLHFCEVDRVDHQRREAAVARCIGDDGAGEGEEDPRRLDQDQRGQQVLGGVPDRHDARIVQLDHESDLIALGAPRS